MRAVVSHLALSFNVLRPTSLCQKAASFVFTGHPCGAFVTHGEFFFCNTQDQQLAECLYGMSHHEWEQLFLAVWRYVTNLLLL